VDPDEPVRPVLLTEFGGVAYGDRGEGWGYSRAEDQETFAAELAALFEAVRSSPVLAGFCYTQLTDTGTETNGLLYADRTPKLPFERVRAMVRPRPSIRIG
jgi:hypothetical protein